MDNYCVMCNAKIPEGRQVCMTCEKDVTQQVQFARAIEPLKPNTELSFGASNGQHDFLVCYRRAKPLNRVQIWMYKICFGIRARNI